MARKIVNTQDEKKARWHPLRDTQRAWFQVDGITCEVTEPTAFRPIPRHIRTSSNDQTRECF